MATTPNAVIASAYATGGISNWQTPGYIRGNVKVMVDYYVGTSSDSTGSVISMHPPLDVGAMILYHVLSASAATSSLTISVGDKGSATRYASASTALQAAGSFLIAPALSSTGNYIIGTNTGDNQIILTTAGATLGTGTVYSLMTLYTID